MFMNEKIIGIKPRVARYNETEPTVKKKGTYAWRKADFLLFSVF